MDTNLEETESLQTLIENNILTFRKGNKEARSLARISFIKNWKNLVKIRGLDEVTVTLLANGFTIKRAEPLFNYMQENGIPYRNLNPFLVSLQSTVPFVQLRICVDLFGYEITHESKEVENLQWLLGALSGFAFTKDGTLYFLLPNYVQESILEAVSMQGLRSRPELNDLSTSGRKGAEILKVALEECDRKWPGKSRTIKDVVTWITRLCEGVPAVRETLDITRPRDTAEKPDQTSAAPIEADLPKKLCGACAVSPEVASQQDYERGQVDVDHYEDEETDVHTTPMKERPVVAESGPNAGADIDSPVRAVLESLPKEQAPAPVDSLAVLPQTVSSPQSCLSLTSFEMDEANDGDEASLRRRIDNLERDLEASEKGCHAFRCSAERLEKDNEELRQAAEDYKTRCSDATQRQRNLAAQLADAVASNDALELDLRKTKEKLQREHEESEARCKVLADDVAMSQARITELEGEVERLRDEVAQTHAKLEAQRELANALDRDRAKQGDAALRRLTNKMRIEYEDYCDAEGLPMSVELGENMRLQLQNIFQILKDSGLKF